MAANRYRVERCAAHGIAIGMCESPGCKGAEAVRAKTVGPTIIRPLKCSGCKQTKGDVVARGEPRASSGYAGNYCESCWEDRERAIENAKLYPNAKQQRLARTWRA